MPEDVLVGNGEGAGNAAELSTHLLQTSLTFHAKCEVILGITLQAMCLGRRFLS